MGGVQMRVGDVIRVVAGLCFALSVFNTSFAADVPTPANKAPGIAPGSYNWSGFYGGVHAGYGWAHGSTDIGIIDGSGALQGAAAAGVFPLSYSYDRDGYVAGGQIGLSWQIVQWVLGIEADISAAGLNGSQTVQRPAVGVFPNLSSVSQDMDLFGTVRGRLGYAWGNSLLYGTGGLAYGRVNYG
jgi:outer membrane immunogenic protein